MTDGSLALRLALLAAFGVLAGCGYLSPSRLAYESLQQRECSVRTGMPCPEQAGGYEAYRAARQQVDAG